MLRNCSACQNKHSPPFGRYCKFIGDSKMSHTEAPAKDSPEYVAYLEGQLSAVTAAKDKSDSTLQTIVNRLDKLEISVARSTVSQSTLTTTTSVTMTTTAPLTTSTLPGVSTTASVWQGPVGAHTASVWSSPWAVPPMSAPPFVNGNPWTNSRQVSSGWPRSTTPHGLPPGFGLPSSFPRAVGVQPPADMVTVPLTTAMEHLAQAIEPTVSTTTKGIQLRPEYYIQHVDQGIAVKSLDHTKLTYRELVCGMSKVLEYLVSINGEASSYLEHMIFLTKQASTHSFNDTAYVAYDRSVVDKVIKGGSVKFIAGDTLSVSSHFHAGNLVPASNTRRQAGRGRGSRGKRSGWFDTDRDTSLIPEGFPTDICYNYNYRQCSGANCQKQHVCRLCKGHHRAQGCQEKRDTVTAKK